MAKPTDPTVKKVGTEKDAQADVLTNDNVSENFNTGNFQSQADQAKANIAAANKAKPNVEVFLLGSVGVTRNGTTVSLPANTTQELTREEIKQLDQIEKVTKQKQYRLPKNESKKGKGAEDDEL